MQTRHYFIFSILILTSTVQEIQSRSFQSGSQSVQGSGSLFTDINADIQPVEYWSSAEWGDFDNDGHLDILMSGRLPGGSFNKYTLIYRNDGHGNFFDILAGLPGIFEGAVAWVDFNNDGDLDVFLSGYIGNGETGLSGLTKIFQNTNGHFVDIDADLVDLYFCSVDWGDYDNDGDMDILLLGVRSQNPRIALTPKIYKNTNGIFSDIEVNFAIYGGGGNAVKWVDIDNDGDLDVSINGNLYPITPTRPRIFRNDGDDIFTEWTTPFAEGMYGGILEWGDYNMDGLWDAFMTAAASGSPFYGSYAKIYRNDLISFCDIVAPIDPLGGQGPAAAWGDYDVDGDLDLINMGFKSHTPSINLYQNMSGQFCDIPIEIRPGYAGSINWGDYDNDRAHQSEI